MFSSSYDKNDWLICVKTLTSRSSIEIVFKLFYTHWKVFVCIFMEESVVQFFLNKIFDEIRIRNLNFDGKYSSKFKHSYCILINSWLELFNNFFKMFGSMCVLWCLKVCDHLLVISNLFARADIDICYLYTKLVRLSWAMCLVKHRKLLIIANNFFKIILEIIITNVVYK